MKKIVLIPLFFLFLPEALAMPTQIPVDCVCVDNRIQVYGEEQPEKMGSGCFVTIDLDRPKLSEEETADDLSFPEDSFVDKVGQGIGRLDEGLIGAGKSLFSPLAGVFEALSIKNNLKTLIRSFFPEAYHQFLDQEVFAKAIALTSSYKRSEDLNEFLKEQKGKCSAENPEPQCVIERALCSYEKYTGILFEEAGERLKTEAVEAEDVERLLKTLQQRDIALIEEAYHAKQALDTAIAVYSQFFQTYRLHLKFSEIITSLVVVKNLSSSMKDLVGCFPNKFVGVATTKCN